MKPGHSVNRLAKFLVTILGKRPDEYGLLPDEDGYVTVKQLMRVLAQEENWPPVGIHQIKEVAVLSRTPVIELRSNRIRAVDRSGLPVPMATDTVPKRLYYPVRRRAYPGILANGVRCAAPPFRIVLTGEKAMADRLGRRIDTSPVVLTVDTDQARSHGVKFWRYGLASYLVDRLPNSCFSGPLLPQPKTAPPDKRPAPPQQPKTPGSYALDIAPTMQPTGRAKRPQRARKNQWKRERKRRHRSGP